MPDFVNKLLKKASSNNLKNGYVDFFIEYPEYVHNQLRLKELPRTYISNTPGIKLPNGNTFYFCRAQKDQLIDIIKSDGFQGKFISDTWDNLWEGDYIYKNYIFEAEGVTQDGTHWRDKIINVDKSITIKKIFVPGVFAGDQLPNLEILDSVDDQHFVDLTINSLALGAINNELFEILKKKPDYLYSLTPRKFEELIASILENHGYKVSITQRTRDGGYDIFCTQKTIEGIDQNLIVECKRYGPSNKVGIDVARSLIGVKEHNKFGSALIATTSFFTRNIIELKSSRYDLHLADYNQINDWLRKI